VTMKKLIRRMVLCVLSAELFLSAASPFLQASEEIRFDMFLSDAKIQPGRQTRLFMKFPAGTGYFSPEIPFIDGLDIRYTGRSSEPSGDIIYSFRIAAFADGDFTIGPLSFNVADTVYTSDAVVISVGPADRAGEHPERPEAERSGISGRIYLEVDLPRRKIYANEAFPVKIKFFSDWLDVENISISDEPAKSYIAGEYVQVGTEIVDIDGTKFALLEYERKLFIPGSGDHTFGPVRADFEITRKTDKPLNDNEDFYNTLLGRRDRRVMRLETEIFPLKTVDLPRENRPAEFSGAIGHFMFEKQDSPEPSVLRVGESAILGLKVRGEGTLTPRTLPLLVPDAGFEVLIPPKVTFKEADLSVIYTIKALDTATVSFPEAVFVYFDPEKEKYISLKLPGSKVNIIPGEGADTPGITEGSGQVSGDRAHTEELIGIKNHIGSPYRGNIFFYRRKWFSVSTYIPLLMLAIFALVKKHRDIIHGDTSYARKLRASARAASRMKELRRSLEKENANVFYAKLSIALSEYLGTRFRISPKDINKLSVNREVRPELGSDELTDEIFEILDDVNFARFSTIVFEKTEMMGTFGRFERLISELDRRKIR
jgi:hypothetical protein